MKATIDPPRQTISAVWDGNALFNAMKAAASILDAHQRRLNALNVYPYPDGDTGTNMSLTIDTAIAEAGKLGPRERADAGAVASRIEYGSLMGARGNSGVILSQMLRGFARAIAGQESIDGGDLARALERGRDSAYKAVVQPVEGTMLTVIRVAADYAAKAAVASQSIADVTSAALEGAEFALADTPNLLAKLKEAGVIDSGGQGVVYLLDGLNRFARGEPVDDLAAAEPDDFAGSMEFLDRISDIHGEDEYGYCTNFMIFGSGMPFDRIRRELAEMGQSAVIVGDETLVKAHVHTENPGLLLAHAIRYGELGQIKIDNMNSQLESLIERRTTATSLASQPHAEPECGQIGVITVAAGDGLVAALHSMGACKVVEGGQTMNPSVEELLAAVDAVPMNDVILLPNNQNILLAAGRVPELTQKRVVVVPSHSIPQALAALESFNDDQQLDDIVDSMQAAIDSVRTVEVTRAEKDATTGGIQVKQGQHIGLLDDRLVAAGDDPAAVALETVKLAGGDEADLITVFIGDNGSPATGDPLNELLVASFENAEIQVYDGGQPHYRYVIAVE